MNTFDHVTIAPMYTNRTAQRIRRLLPGSVFVATLAALPRFAHAATGGAEHMYEVVAAFGVLVVAATLASIVTAWSQRNESAALVQPEYPRGSNAGR